MTPKHARRGFTLIEILVVLAVLGVVSTIGFTAFFNVAGAWRLSTFRLDLGRTAEAALDAIEADINHLASSRRTGHALKGIDVLNEQVKYQGMVRLEDDRLILPLIRSGREGKTERLAVQYQVDRESGSDFVLYRTFGKLDGSTPEGARTPIAEGVLTFEIQYLDGGTWHDQWDADHHPEGVRVSMTVMGPRPRTQEQISRSAFFPIHVK